MPRQPTEDKGASYAKLNPLPEHGRGARPSELRIIFCFALDEWLPDRPTEPMRGMLLELMVRRYGETSTVFCTQYLQRDWDQRLGSAVHADAVMDRIIHNTIWVETGNYNMREHAALVSA